MERKHYAIHINQAAEEAPILGSLLQCMQLSQQCSQSIARLVPPMMRSRITWGAVQDGEWCVIISGNAVAAKVRQLLPLWLSRLPQDGLPVQRIRLHMAGSGPQR